MKQEVYTLLNEMEHSADSYGEFRADADDVRNWKKTIPVKSSRRKRPCETSFLRIIGKTIL